MFSAVRSRPSYYEILGVKPTATSDDIAQAFARESSVFRPHSFGGAAEVCMAYATLRDPIKRRSYDVSIGLKSEPEPQPQKWTVGPREATASVPMMPAKFVDHSRIQANPPATPQAGTGPRHRPLAEPTPAPDPVIRPRPQAGGEPLKHRGLPEGVAVDIRPIEWKRTGMLLGAVVVAACVIGGLAGWWSAADIGDTPQPEQAASLSIPLAEPQPAAERPWPGSDRKVVATGSSRTKHGQIATPRPKRAPTIPSASGPEMPPPESLFPDVPAEQNQLAEPSEAVATPPASPAAASLPLPNRVVARTIERIGYACGEVAATSPGEAPGVFKVTCTSGQSYQAKPVNGRYRFRRLGKP